MRKIFFILITLIVISGVSFSAVIDDFEDGDYTNNPEWIITNSTGDSAIYNDPIRANNLVLGAYGNLGSQRVLETSLDATRWSGFNFSVEFLSSTDGFHPYFRLLGDGYQIRLEVQRGEPTENVR